MSAKHLAGFAAICGVVVVGLDYFHQSKASDGDLSIRSYVSSRLGIFEETQSADAEGNLPLVSEGGNVGSQTGQKLTCAAIGTSKRCRSDG